MVARTSSPGPRVRLAGALALLIGVLAGCSGQASTRASADESKPVTTAAQVTSPATIPPGTTLRVGDQLDYIKGILQRGGQDQGLGYTIEWSNFVGGPPMLQAFKGGAIDSGFVASTPLLFAAAQGQPI